MIARLALVFTTRRFVTTPYCKDLREFVDLKALKGAAPDAGNSWSAAQLRLKSWDDLHKLWFVLLKEKLMLKSEFLRYKALGEKVPERGRYRNVKKSMCRIKFVLTERALADPNPQRRLEMKRRINAL